MLFCTDDGNRILVGDLCSASVGGGPESARTSGNLAMSCQGGLDRRPMSHASVRLLRTMAFVKTASIHRGLAIFADLSTVVQDLYLAGVRL